MLLEHAKVNTSEEDVARSLEESYRKDCIKKITFKYSVEV